jgi:quercetin dioxygenase-like cupin family protein
MGYSYVDVEAIEPRGPGDAVRFVRRELGATAFGINHFTLPPGTAGREHDESASGQEEVMIVLEGSGVLKIDGGELELRPGRFVRIDPETTRVPVAGENGLVIVTVGSPRREPYVARGPF